VNFLLGALLMLQSATPSGSISGTVVIAGSASQAPLAMARVELSGGPMLSLVVRTDGSGRFAFANLQPGSYQLHVTKDGYLRQDYARRAAVVIKPDMPHKSVVFEMEPAPTMAGHIQNEFGEPIANILVQAMKAVYGTDGKRTYTALASTLSDDRGNYRLYWLDPGDYIISASFVPAVKTPGNPNEPVAPVVYAPTYYPDASALANAQRIPLKADQNSLTRDFRLVRAQAVTVRGSTTKANHPLSTNVTLTMAGDATGKARYAAKSDEQGTFEFYNVAPGSYIATAESMVGSELYKASKHIVVYDHDENNVGLILSPGEQVQGHITLDTGATVNPGAAHVSLASVDPYLDSFDSAGFQSDGQFVIRNVQPGEYMFDIAGLPEDLYIKSERYGQTNVSGTALGITSGLSSPLEILIGADGGRVDGTVADAGGKLFAGAQIVLVPKGERRNRPDQYRVSYSDEDGKFALSGIPPGDYLLFAWENVEDRAWLNSEFVAKYQELGVGATIPANARGSIQLSLIPEKP
jgi:hypothetical protein